MVLIVGERLKLRPIGRGRKAEVDVAGRIDLARNILEGRRRQGDL